MRRDLVVIGASAGGLEATRAIVAELPRDFSASVCVVIHVSPDSPGVLAAILDRQGPLPAVSVGHSERLEPGVIYVPRPDHHLIVEPSRVRASHGPRENRFRPAIDPLFRSAAQAYGPRVIGVILSGGLDDGTAGLWAVKQLGGLAVVQDPEEALVDSMPRSALAHVKVDHCVTVSDIPALLVQLTREDIAEKGGYVVPQQMRIEVNIANENSPLEAGVEQLGEPSKYACPECHGVLLQVNEGDRVRFRCHTGHAFSSDALIAEFDQAIEDALWISVRAMQEKVLLLERLVETARERKDTKLVEALGERLEEVKRRAEAVRKQTQVPAAD